MISAGSGGILLGSCLNGSECHAVLHSEYASQIKQVQISLTGSCPHGP